MPKLQGTTTSYPLRNVSLAYSNDGLNFIHDIIAPKVKVVQPTGKIYSYGTDALRVLNDIRSRGGKSKGVDWSLSLASHYDLEDHSLHTYIPVEDYANEEQPIDLKNDTTEIVTEMIMVAKEYALAQAMQSVSTMTLNTTLTGTDQWSDYANSDPLDDILTGIKAVKTATGKIPNTLILAWDTLLTLQYHPKIKDLLPGVPMITEQNLRDAISKIFPGIKKIVVGMAMYEGANLGAVMDLGDIWTRTAIVAYIEPKPKKKSRTLAYTYQREMSREVQFIAAKGSNDTDLITRKSDFLQVSDEYDQVLVDVKCGYLIKDTQ